MEQNYIDGAYRFARILLFSSITTIACFLAFKEGFDCNCQTTQPSELETKLENVKAGQPTDTFLKYP